MQAPGAGKTVQALVVPYDRAIVYLSISRVSGSPGSPDGDKDSAGFDLHCVYRPSPVPGRANRRSDNAPGQQEIPFDGGCHVLPWCGEILLVGGTGEYQWSYIVEPFGGQYAPSLHPLSVWVSNDIWYRIPDDHTLIASLNGQISMQADDGEHWILDGNPKPVRGGRKVKPASHAQIITWWVG